jgi:hypothetical protein
MSGSGSSFPGTCWSRILGPDSCVAARKGNVHAGSWIFGLEKLTTTSIIPLASPLRLYEA